MRRAWWFTRGCLSQQLWSYKVPESRTRRTRTKTWFYGSFNRFHICWAVFSRLTSLLSAWRKHVKLYIQIIQYSDVTHWAPVNSIVRNWEHLNTFEIFEECGLMWLVTGISDKGCLHIRGLSGVARAPGRQELSMLGTPFSIGVPNFANSQNFRIASKIASRIA